MLLMAVKKKLVVGNWKMHPGTLAEAKRDFSTFKKKRLKDVGVTTVICPPFVYLNDLSRLYFGNKIFFGVQNLFWKDEGSFTGEIGPNMVKSLGAKFAIVGHSERRALGENDEMIAQKVKASLGADLHTILCVGEPTRDSHGNYLRFIQGQIKDSLRGVSKPSLKKLIVAYEPIWAVGQGNSAMAPHEIHQMILFIKKQLITTYGKKIGDAIPILYGGSTDADNVHDIVYEGGVDGVLVGRKSLNPHEFADMITEVARKPKAKTVRKTIRKPKTTRKTKTKTKSKK